jgi:hypothetical protein
MGIHLSSLIQLPKKSVEELNRREETTHGSVIVSYVKAHLKNLSVSGIVTVVGWS